MAAANRFPRCARFAGNRRRKPSVLVTRRKILWLLFTGGPKVKAHGRCGRGRAGALRRGEFRWRDMEQGGRHLVLFGGPDSTRGRGRRQTGAGHKETRLAGGISQRSAVSTRWPRVPLPNI